MNNITLLFASIAFLGASGLAIWLWFAVDNVDDELREFSGLQGIPIKL